MVCLVALPDRCVVDENHTPIRYIYKQNISSRQQCGTLQTTLSHTTATITSHRGSSHPNEATKQRNGETISYICLWSMAEDHNNCLNIWSFIRLMCTHETDVPQKKFIFWFLSLFFHAACTLWKPYSSTDMWTQKKPCWKRRVLLTLLDGTMTPTQAFGCNSIPHGRPSSIGSPSPPLPFHLGAWTLLCCASWCLNPLTKAFNRAISAAGTASQGYTSPGRNTTRKLWPKQQKFNRFLLFWAVAVNTCRLSHNSVEWWTVPN